MYRNYYLDSNLIGAWSDDRETVGYYNPLTKEDGGKRRIDSIFYYDYPTFPQRDVDSVERLKGYFALTLSSLKSGSVNLFREGTEVARQSLLFQHTRLPFFNKIDYIKYGYNNSLKELNGLKGRSYFERDDYHIEISGQFYSRVINFVEFDSIEIMDLTPVLLDAPVGLSFVIGGSPFNLMNPYFEKRFVKTGFVDKNYDMKGTVMVLPLTPERALMLFDGSIYVAPDKKVITLTPSDVDILNKVQIYNGDMDGVVYKGDKAYLDSIFSTIKNNPYRDGYEWTCGYRFPFTTLLSFMSIKDEAVREMSKNVKAPIRPFVYDIREFEYGNGMSESRPNGMENLNKRYEYAKALIND